MPEVKDNNHTDQVDLRDIALTILCEHETKGTYLHLLIRKAQDRYESLPLTQRSFLKRLVEGTVERKLELDAVIDRHLNNPQVRMKTTLRCLLRMSVYQIYYMNSVPDFAACDEAVRLCRKRHLAAQAGFVNGLLRTICREKENNLQEGREVSFAAPRPTRTRQSDALIIVKGADSARQQTKIQDEDLRLRTSIPQEILDLWRGQLGEERMEPLCEAMLEVRPVCIRLDARLREEEKEEVLEALRAKGVELTPGRWARDAWYLRHVPDLRTLPGFAEGKWTVQDESSQLTAQALGLTGRKADRGGALEVYDVCAAPGGKTMLAAAYLPQGQIHASDLTRQKTDLIRAGLRRMQLENVTVSEMDAQNLPAQLREKADLVICDVPCSGLGVMTRKRDIKYNVTMQKIRSLVALQKKIALNAAACVKPGGILLYSTCTINRLENERIASYIEQHTALVPDDLAPYLPEDFPGIRGNQVQLFPDLHGTDGFFMARFRRP